MKTRACDNCRQEVFLSATHSEISRFELFDTNPVSGWQRTLDETGSVHMVPAVVYAAHSCAGYLEQRERMREKSLFEKAAGVQRVKDERDRARRRTFERRVTIAQDIADITGTDDGWTTLSAIEDIAFEVVCDKCEASKDDSCRNLAATRNRRTNAHPHPERIYAALTARKISTYIHSDGRARLYPIADTPLESADGDW